MTDSATINILSASVGAAAGVYTNAGLAKLSGQSIDNVGLVLSAGVGSIIGTGLNTYLNNETRSIFLEDSIAGATGAMIGCAAGQLIVNDIQFIGFIAALGAAAAIDIARTPT